MNEKVSWGVAGPPAPFSLGAALAARRRDRHLTRREVSRRTRIKDGTLARYEDGLQHPTPEEMTRLAHCLGTTPARLHGEGEALAALRRAPAGASFEAVHSALLFGRDFRAALIETARAMALPAARPCPKETGPERRLAEDSWRRLEPLSPEARRRAIGWDPILANPLFQRWGLAERLCLESEAASADDPERARHLAELALYVAERVDGEPAWRNHLQGYAWAFIAKAKLAGGDRAGAESALAQGRSLWNPRSIEEPDFLKWPEMPGLGERAARIGPEPALLDAERLLAVAGKTKPTSKATRAAR